MLFSSHLFAPRTDAADPPECSKGGPGAGGRTGKTKGTPRVQHSNTPVVLFPRLLPLQMQHIHQSAAQEITGLAAALGLPISVHQSYMLPSEFNPWDVKIDPDEAVGVAAWSAMQLLPDESILRHSPRDGFLKVGCVHLSSPLVTSPHLSSPQAAALPGT